MANPFKVKFDSECNSCGNEVPEGAEMYAHDDSFVCYKCAEENGNVCDCGNYKKDEYEECFECHNDEINYEPE